jgi:CheY-like chemotaxis protein
MNASNDYQILVVEDTPQMAQLTLLILERAGYKAAHAVDGESAIAYLEQNSPDLVLLDLNLPGISGWDVMAFIIQRFGTGNLRVIVTTAYGDSANRVVGKLQSVTKYIVKPFSPQDLISAVQSALAVPQ